MNKERQLAKKYKTNKTLKQYKDENRFYISEGNTKLVSNDKVLFLIWNLPYRITCPFATELCKVSCYAEKAENLYKDCKPSRFRNFEFSKSDDFVSSIIDYISIKLNNLKKGRKIIFRIHESGDFYNRKYLANWLEIIRFFANDNRIKFVCYTKSVRFFVGTDFRSLKNFVVRYSVWADTKETEKEIARSLNLPTYTALEREEMDKLENFVECRCEDCATCLKCFSYANKSIICEIH